MAAIVWKVDWNWAYFLIFCAFMILIRSFKRFIQKIHKALYAYLYYKLCDRRNRQLFNRKEALFKELHLLSAKITRALCVLEVGCGAGSNFGFLPKGTNIMCLDPNPFFEKYVKRNSEKFPDINLQEFLVGRAEDLSILPNGCVDAVISSGVLCCVSDVELSLSEIKRVLKPGGSFYYVEHVGAEKGTWTYSFQRMFNSISKSLLSNCHLDRNIAKYINESGFTVIKHEHFYNDARRLLFKRPYVIGKATKD